jgi:hypothetical protein
MKLARASLGPETAIHSPKSHFRERTERHSKDEHYGEPPPTKQRYWNGPDILQPKRWDAERLKHRMRQGATRKGYNRTEIL